MSTARGSSKKKRPSESEAIIKQRVLVDDADVFGPEFSKSVHQLRLKIFICRHQRNHDRAAADQRESTEGRPEEERRDNIQKLLLVQSFVHSNSQCRNNNIINKVGTPNFAQENQPIKKQKLDAEKSRQIFNIKPQTLPHKTRCGLVSNNSSLCTSTNKTRKEDRKIYAREMTAPPPFVSMAEMMNKFHSNTRDMSLSHPSSFLTHNSVSSVIKSKPKLTLTRPKEPEFETSHRVRSVRVKSSAELEEEMMAYAKYLVLYM